MFQIITNYLLNSAKFGYLGIDFRYLNEKDSYT